jgi:hypothetical protein
MRQLLGLLLLTVICSAPLARAADIREDMVMLDRAVIPALVLTTENRPDLALKAMRAARSKWAAFKERYYNFKTTDADWRRDFDRVDALMWEAHTIIDGGRQVALAQAPLERVNAVMGNLRRRNGIDHYFDQVTAVRAPLNAIVGAAETKAPADDAVTRIRASYETVRQAWERMVSSEPSTGYQLTSGERETLQARLELETAALEALGKALAGNDRAAIIAAAAAIKLPFSGVYNFFGDFHALMWEGS